MLVSAFFAWKNFTGILINKINYIIKEKKHEQSN